MLKLAIMLSMGASIFLEAVQCYDEPLCKNSWSYFGPLCKHYVAGRREKPNGIYDILKSYVSSDASVLDLGSGTGISTRQLCKNGFKNIIGVDRDQLMIQAALEANTPDCRIKYICADVSNGLPFPDDEFDVVTACSAFHWFSNPTSIREAARVLKPHGYYFIIGARGRKCPAEPTHPIKEAISEIFHEAGVPPKPIKYPMCTAAALEAQGFKIVLDREVQNVQEYSKQEYLEKIQSQSTWNLVAEGQREQLLKTINRYLDSVVNEQGKIRLDGQVVVILAQKS